MGRVFAKESKEPTHFLARINMKLKTLLLLALAYSQLASAQTLTPKENLWTIADGNTYIGFSAGWVAKEWTTHIKGRTLHEDLWGNPDKMLHGLQIGFSGYRFIKGGLGARYGLFYEWYRSKDQFLKDMGWERFNEYNLYIPIHAAWRLPTPKKFSIIPYGGVGFNWAITGNVKKGSAASAIANTSGLILDLLTDDEIYQYRPKKLGEKEYFDYNNNTPHHWNVQAELGVDIEIHRIKLGFAYSWGLNNHQLYDTVPSNQNKFSVNVGLLINADDD